MLYKDVTFLHYMPVYGSSVASELLFESYIYYSFIFFSLFDFIPSPQSLYLFLWLRQPGVVGIVVNHSLLFNMLDALPVVAFVLDPPRNLNLPSPNLPYPHLPSLNLPNLPRPRNLIQPPDSLDLPGCVGIAVNHLRLQQRDMLDALHAVVLELNRPRNLNQVPSCLNQLPSCLNPPGRVGIVVNYSLLLDMFDALHN